MNEQKNLLLAIVASLLILMIFQYLFPNKSDIKKVENGNITTNDNLEFKTGKTISRSEVVSSEDRIFIENDSRLKGSISLKGGRFDDIILKDYNESLSEKSELVTIFSPRETNAPYFAEFGWIAKNNTDVPRPDTLWKIKNGKEIKINEPIILEWSSPDGFIFTRVISVDENYMFTIEQKIKNNSGKTENFIPYGRINRTGTPKYFRVLHSS